MHLLLWPKSASNLYSFTTLKPWFIPDFWAFSATDYDLPFDYRSFGCIASTWALIKRFQRHANEEINYNNSSYFQTRHITYQPALPTPLNSQLCSKMCYKLLRRDAKGNIYYSIFFECLTDRLWEHRWLGTKRRRHARVQYIKRLSCWKLNWEVSILDLMKFLRKFTPTLPTIEGTITLKEIQLYPALKLEDGLN